MCVLLRMLFNNDSTLCFPPRIWLTDWENLFRDFMFIHNDQFRKKRQGPLTKLLKFKGK